MAPPARLTTCGTAALLGPQAGDDRTGAARGTDTAAQTGGFAAARRTPPSVASSR